NAYANFAPHIGYCQGMNFVCGFLLLIAAESRASASPRQCASPESSVTAADSGTALAAAESPPRSVLETYEEYEVFYMLCLLMARYHLHGFYRESFPLLDPFVDECQRRCRIYCPSLISHFEKENVLAPVYIHQWFLTLFVTSLPAGATVVLWDYILASNVHSVVSITMSLLSVLQSFLLRLRFEGIVRFLKSLRNSGNCDEFRIGRMLVKQAEDFQPMTLNTSNMTLDTMTLRPDTMTLRPDTNRSIDFSTGNIDWAQILYVSAATLYTKEAEPTVQLDLTPPSGGDWNNPFASIVVDVPADSDEEPANKKTTTRHFFSRQH
ncbi:TBC domain protein, partial [Gregarina niphandrodes]